MNRWGELIGIEQFAIENGPFIVDLPIENCDLPIYSGHYISYNVRPPLASVQLVNITPSSLWFYGIYNELVTGANLNQLISWGPHIVAFRCFFQLYGNCVNLNGFDWLDVFFSGLCHLDAICVHMCGRLICCICYSMFAGSPLSGA